jgi:hypothetical protein
MASAGSPAAAKPAAATSDGRRRHDETNKAKTRAARGVVPRLPPHLIRKITHEERMAALRFIKAAHEDALLYADTPEEVVEEEYRRAGNLHKYDPDTEWQKRYARVARKYPPPDFIAPDLDEFMKILEEDEQDLPIGLAGCVGIHL